MAGADSPRRRPSRVVLAFLVGLGLAGQGCASGVPRLVGGGEEAAAPALPPPPPEGYDYSRPYPLLPGDRISIVVLDDPALNVSLEVPSSGYIEVYKSDVGSSQREKVLAKGRTITELAEAIAEVYSRTKFTSKPYVQVLVELAVPRVVYIMGEVKSEGAAIPLPAAQRMTLSQAIFAASGPTERADLTRVTITRKDPATGGEVSLPVYNMREMIERAAYDRDPPLEPNDIITIPRLGDVSVFGNVQSPGNYLCKPGMTLLTLFSEAGGLKPFSKWSDVRVIRGEGLRTERVYSVDVNEVLVGRSPDPRLQPGDRIFVEEDWK